MSTGGSNGILQALEPISASDATERTKSVLKANIARLSVEARTAKTKWRRSTGGPGFGVEVAFLDGVVAVRDSKQIDSPALTFTHAQWAAFVKGVQQGEFERPP
jgi:hypothetical protein